MRFLSKKILSNKDLLNWRDSIKKQNKKVIVTNGCYDILHSGHVTYLESAREQGDCLLVGIDSDDSIRKIKGPNRPINSEIDRAIVLAGLASVDAVYIFENALDFLCKISPDIYVKGGDYSLDTINQEERRFLEKNNIKIVILNGIEGKSSTGIIKKILDVYRK